MSKLDKNSVQERINRNRISIPSIRRQTLLPAPTINLPTNSRCSNHANKQATYSMNIAEKQYLFCEKCAISLVSQGHSLLKIQAKNASNQQHHIQRVLPSIEKTQNTRQKEISKFLSNLYQLRGTLKQTKQAIVQKLIESQQFYGEQLQQVNDYFSLIIKSLELQKHKCYNHILNQRLGAQQHIRGINEDLAAIDEDICKIIDDVEDNLETAYNIQEEMYRLVLSQYTEQQEYFYQNINGLLLMPIELKKIEFEGVPESIYKLSDIVIQSSIKNKQNQFYRLADSLNSEDFLHIQAISPRIDYIQSPQYKAIKTIQNLKLSFEGEKMRGSVLHQIHQNQQITSNKTNN